MLLLLLACSANNTGFSATPPPTQGQEGDILMTIDPMEMKITDCVAGEARSGSVHLESVGEGTLTVYSVRLTGDSSIFYFEPLDALEFYPDQGTDITVVATLADDQPQEANLQFRSNDKNNPTLNVPVYAWPVGYTPPADTGTQDTGKDSG